jgi:hypothetical protein
MQSKDNNLRPFDLLGDEVMSEQSPAGPEPDSTDSINSI